MRFENLFGTIRGFVSAIIVCWCNVHVIAAYVYFLTRLENT